MQNDKTTIEWLEILASAFGEISLARRNLEDNCTLKEDRDRSRIRSLICSDIAEALRITIQKHKI